MMVWLFRIFDNSLWREQAVADAGEISPDMEMFGINRRRPHRDKSSPRGTRINNTRDSLGNIYDAVAIEWNTTAHNSPIYDKYQIQSAKVLALPW